MDFREGQEAVPVAAVIDEGRLQRGLYAGDFGEVDIAAKLFAVSGFEVEFFDPVAAQDHDPCLFRVGGVDEHFVGHWIISLRHTRRRACTSKTAQSGAMGR